MPGPAGDWLPGGGRAGGPHRLAERPNRGREQGNVLDEELAEDANGREPSELIDPGPRGRHQEAEGAQEHPDRQQAAEGRNPGEPGSITSSASRSLLRPKTPDVGLPWKT